MTETIKVGGGNVYKLPHMGNELLDWEGNLPEVFFYDLGLVTATHLSPSQRNEQQR